MYRMYSGNAAHTPREVGTFVASVYGYLFFYCKLVLLAF